MGKEKLDWRRLYYGRMNTKEVLSCVKDKDWQVTRLSMKGQKLKDKYCTLLYWLKNHAYKREAQVQVTNYVTALSRGGLIKPSQYRSKQNKGEQHASHM